MVSNCNNFICHDEHLRPQLEAPVEVLPVLRREHVKVLLVVALLIELAAEECVLEEERVRRLVSRSPLELPKFRHKCRGSVSVQGHLNQTLCQSRKEGPSHQRYTVRCIELHELL